MQLNPQIPMHIYGWRSALVTWNPFAEILDVTSTGFEIQDYAAKVNALGQNIIYNNNIILRARCFKAIDNYITYLST